MRRHRTKRPQRQLPEPLAVLEGRITVRVEDLFDLIHAINPTQRQLAAKEKTRRYRLKSRLQSLLIRQFGDQYLTVTRTAGQLAGGNVVSLDHRSGLRDACHAVLDELEPDARAWVQRQLDFQAQPGVSQSEELQSEVLQSEVLAPELTIIEARSVPEDRAASIEELLARARQSIDSYDYEAAETQLALAFERSQGAIEAAQPYLELLVDLLGMDDEALRIEPLLASDALQGAVVRASLALAAARTGASDKAAQLIRGVGLRPAAEVYAVLAEQAIRSRDRPVARRNLDLVIEHDPPHPLIPRLEQELADLLATEHRPAEEALRERFEQEGALAVEDDARTLGELWPASEVVRQVLREAAELNRQAAIVDLQGRGDQAFADHRYPEAARHWQQALEAGSERPDLARLVEEAEACERERQASERVASVSAGLQDAVDRDALMSFLALPEALRQRVREQHSEPVLTWLETMGAPASGVRAQTMVQAALALERAQTAFQQGELRRAIDEISPYLKELQGVTEAQQLNEQAHRKLTLAQQEQVRSGLATVRKALAEGRLEEAGFELEAVAQSLASIELVALVADERRQLKALRTRLEHARTVQLLMAEIERLRQAGEPLAALACGRDVLERATEEEREGARLLVAELEAGVQQAWRVEVVEGCGPLSEVASIEPPFPLEKAAVWLEPSGRQLLLTEVSGRWLFLYWVDLERQEVSVRVSLRAPRPLDVGFSVTVEDRRIWILSNKGEVLEIGRCDWEILSWRCLEDLLPEQIKMHSVMLVPGSHHAGAPMVWVDIGSKAEDSKWRCCTVDLNRWQIQGELEDSWALALVKKGPPRVVSAPFLGGAHLRDARGKEIVGGLLPLGGQLQSVAAAPEGDGLVMVDRREPRGDIEDEKFIDRFFPRLIRHGGEGMFLVWAEPEQGAKAYRVRTSAELTRSSECGGDTVATSSEQGLSFVLVVSGTAHPVELRAFEPDATGLRELYRVDLPVTTDLIQDAKGRWVVAVTDGAAGLEMHRLGPEPPRIHLEPAGDQRLPVSNGVFDCDAFDTDPLGEGATLGDNDSLDDAVMRAESALSNRGGDGQSDSDDEVVRWLAMCQLALQGVAASELPVDQIAGLEEAREAMMQHPWRFTGAYFAACEAAKLADWDTVEALLAVSDQGDLEERHLRHYYHLRGLLHLHRGRDREALVAFDEADQHQGSCELEPLIDLTRPMPSTFEAESWGPDQPVIRQLIGAIRSADEAFAAGDLEQTRRILERPSIWRAQELQSSARRARLWLATATTSPRERHTKRRALAQFFFLQNLGRQSMRHQILRADLSWDTDRLAALAERAEAWLETGVDGISDVLASFHDM